jgi:hypothetical protein
MVSCDWFVDFFVTSVYKGISVILSSGILKTEGRMAGRQSFATFMSMAGAVVCLCFTSAVAVAEGNYEFMQAGTATQQKYVGPGSCSATACHGSVQPRKETKVLQNEYSTWIVQDKHAKAQQVLSNPVSMRIAKILGLPDAAHAPKCLACHALYVSPDQKARDFDIAEGVSCESCHGPALAWLGPHTSKSQTHAQNVALGLYDTKDLVHRTEKCMTCHLGTSDKFVDHEMIAAGHPDLVFELDSFQAVEPVHWVEKDPKRPAEASRDPLFGVRAWSVGQAVQLKESMDRLARRARGKVWPEYAELDCFTCHHSLTSAEDSWRQARGYEGRRAGNPPYNVSRYVVFKHLVHDVDPQTAQRLDEELNKVASLVTELQPNRDEIADHAARVATLSGVLANSINAMTFDKARTARLMKEISADADYISNNGERCAEQATMALDSLYIAYSKDGSPNPEVKQAINALFQQLENPSAYNGRKFAAQLKKIGTAIP